MHNILDRAFTKNFFMDIYRDIKIKHGLQLKKVDIQIKK